MAEPREADAAASAVELPRAQQRLAIAALSLAAFVLNLNTNVLGALLPFLQGALSLSKSDAESLIAASAFGTAMGALAVGFVARAIGRNRTTLLGLLVFVAASFAHGAVSSLTGLLVVRWLSGAAAGLSYSAASAIAAQVVPYARRGQAMGWFTAGMFLAIPVGMPLSVWFAKQGSWSAIFTLQGVFGAFAIAVVAFLVPRAQGEVDRPQWGALLRDGQVLSGLGATMLHVGSFFATVQLATSWLDATGRVAKEDQMWLWIALGLLSVVGSALFGRVADRIGKRAFVLGTSIVLASCFLVLAFEPGPVGMLLTAAVLAVTAAARTGPLQALLSGLVPAALLGSLMGLRSASMHVGSGAFALAAKPIALALGFTGVLLFAACCQLVSFAAIRFGVRGRQATDS